MLVRHMLLPVLVVVILWYSWQYRDSAAQACDLHEPPVCTGKYFPVRAVALRHQVVKRTCHNVHSIQVTTEVSVEFTDDYDCSYDTVVMRYGVDGANCTINVKNAETAAAMMATATTTVLVASDGTCITVEEGQHAWNDAQFASSALLVATMCIMWILIRDIADHRNNEVVVTVDAAPSSSNTANRRSYGSTDDSAV